MGPAACSLDERIAGNPVRVASYAVNEPGVAQARRLIDARQYVLDSEWGERLVS